MNKTKIDWCDYSWNPVTGCLHGCEYCYARKIANRFKHKGNLTYVNGVKPGHLSNIPYPWGFLPTFHPSRLNDPQKVKKPQSIFVCSMADLFGEWVPDEWIKEVFEACKKAPHHRYLFLTKNPKRYNHVFRTNNDYRCYMWLGTTITSEQDIDKAWELLKLPNKVNTFLSIEPILDEINLNKYELLLNNWRDKPTIGKYLDWIIVGAETGNRKGKVVPKKEWIMDIKSQCRVAGVPLFMKESLRKLMGQEFVQEFPWDKGE